MYHLLEHLDGAAGRSDGADDGRHAVIQRRRVDVELAQRLEVGAGERRRQLLDVRPLGDERHAAGPARNGQKHSAAGLRRRAGRVMGQAAPGTAVNQHLSHREP